MATALATLLLFALPAAVCQGAIVELDSVIWSSVLFTMHGESTPMITDTTYNLSPLGALQLQSAGSLVRDRYISGNNSGATISLPITGLSQNTIDNRQLNIVSTTDEYVSAGATAFMQGLYPAVAGVNGAQDVLGNGSNINFPLDGYQYPNIMTPSIFDYQYIYQAGNIECPVYYSSADGVNTVAGFLSSSLNIEAFYRSLAPTLFSSLNPLTLVFTNAYNLYDYALYQYNHNSTVYELDGIAETIAELYNIASEQTSSINTANNVQTISGSTLAAKVLDTFDSVILTAGISPKLTLLFGSYEPFLAFFSLSHLSSSSLTTSKFRNLPLHGSIMGFELFSYVATSPGSSKQVSSPEFPDSSQLFVRFVFRNGTADSETITEYPIFNRGVSTADMTYSEFVASMTSISSSLTDWCNTCDSTSMFCVALESDTSFTNPATGTLPGDIQSGPASSIVTPVIAGIIGATVAIASVIVLAVALGCLGFRMQHSGNRGIPGWGGRWGRGTSGIGAVGGGFKGPEKKPEDQDVGIVDTGAGTRHERVGSWELGDSKRDGGIGSLDKDLESGVGGWRGGEQDEDEERIVSTADYSKRSEEHLPLEGAKAFEHI